MKCLAIQTSPNTDGLTAATAQAVLDGFASEGGEIELIHLNHMDIKPCLACERGWGPCRGGECTQEDDLEAIREKIREADAFVFVTPVYWHDLSESAKRFLDRLRRVETFSGRDTFVGTRTIGVTAAGGSGNGAARALHNLEDYLKRVGLELVDLVTITKFSRDHKLPMLEHAGKRLAQGVPGVVTRQR
ncbi:flavodoxin family protein [Candidatus Bathyarchaeota archaeon]|nr:flavodoxin family protein [Candidatus Bathyarchaeota archaeon]MBL7080353.1 flavodoxin family protein [Candidatus Bathyarchaeota archaeon]